MSIFNVFFRILITLKNISGKADIFEYLNKFPKY